MIPARRESRYALLGHVMDALLKIQLLNAKMVYRRCIGYRGMTDSGKPSAR
jgi:hypothetical protein